jgi:hypothetical protein
MLHEIVSLKNPWKDMVTERKLHVTSDLSFD